VTTFHYENNLCTKIVTPWQTVNACTRFAYMDEKLISVTYEDGKSTSYIYTIADGFRLLVSAEGPEHLTVSYEYTNVNVSGGLPHYVTRATVNGTEHIASDVNYEYGDLVTNVIDRISGKSLRYHFNDNGNQISVDDGLGYALYTRYDRVGDNESAPVNHATMRSAMQRVVNNLLTDPMFEDNSSKWVTGGVGTFARAEDWYRWGFVCRRITITAGSEAWCRQSIGLTPGKSYTLSSYVKSNGPKAFLRILYTVNGNTHTVESDPAMIVANADRLSRGLPYLSRFLPMLTRQCIVPWSAIPMQALVGLTQSSWKKD